MNSVVRKSQTVILVGAGHAHLQVITRAEALIAESKVAPRCTSSRHRVATGKWYS